MTYRSATKPSAKPRQVVKITANLPVPVFNALQTIATKRGISMTEALRQAISTEVFVDDAIKREESLLLKNKEGSVREVVFSR